MRQIADVVVVGGGLAGAAMATVLGRAGLQVVLLERQPAHQDRIRGELMVPWGVAEARRLGLLDVLLGAGAHWVTRRVPYDETVTPEEAEAMTFPLGEIVEGVPGALTFFQPPACEALMVAAAKAGATVHSGVHSVTVAGGQRPEVVYHRDGTSTTVRCSLVIGADGRTSSVRRQAGIPMERVAAEHLCSAMLVEDVSGFPEDTFALGVEGDVTFFVCPQGGGRVRLYLCHALNPRDRFAGSDGAAAFLRCYRLRSVPGSDSLAGATVAGPCGTMECDDTWTDEPFADGVVLVGDAAGYNNPLIGQGLALAMRDVRVLSDLLLSERRWSLRTLRPYGEERAERMRRVRIVATAMATLNGRYTTEARERRLRMGDRMRSDPVLGAPLKAVYAGPETAPAEAFTPAFISRLTGPVLNVPA